MKTLITSLPIALHAMALLVTLALAELLPTKYGLMICFPAYPLTLALIAGLVSRCVASKVTPGRFVRDPGTSLYRGRMIYGAAWTSLYYCKPVLHLLLSCPPLKAMVFRLFGYKGSLDFTIYPDSWIRDLRLLDFGPGTYIANRATLGTNHVRSDGKIQVGVIKTGCKVIIGHLAMVGGGTHIGDNSEVGCAAKVGFMVRIGSDVSIGPDAVVDSGTRLMGGVHVGARAYIGKRCVIHEGVRIPAGATIPDRSVINCAADITPAQSYQHLAA